jgi:hypothetical protein
LARIAARAAASGSTSVLFVVDHGADGPIPQSTLPTPRKFSEMSKREIRTLWENLRPKQFGKPVDKTAPASARGSEETAAAEPTQPGREGEEVHSESARTDLGATARSAVPREEFLYFEVGGAGINVRTEASDEKRVRRPQVEMVARPERRDPVFKGRAVLNPGFLYQNGRGVEALLSVPHRQGGPSLGEAVQITSVAKAIASAAVDVEAPILFMHYPASQPDPPRPGGQHRGARLAATLRVSVAVDESAMEQRLDLLDDLVELATKEGFGLHLSDMRPTAVRGEWRLIHPTAVDGGEAWPAHPGDISDEPVHDVLPVTVVGPARVGSSLAVLTALADHGIGIVGISISALQEIAFISLLVAIPSGVSMSEGVSLPAGEGIKEVIRKCRPRTPATPRLDVALGDKANGYEILFGPSRKLSVAPPASRRRPIWLYWDIPDQVTSSAILPAIHEALEVEDEAQRHGRLDPRIEYACGRSIDNDRFRGRAKISIKEPVADPVRREAALSDITAQVEDYAREELATMYPGAGELIFRVEWQESWLGARPRHEV